MKEPDGLFDVIWLVLRFWISTPLNLAAVGLANLAGRLAGFRRVVSVGIFEHDRLGYVVFTRSRVYRTNAGQWHQEIETARTSLVFNVDRAIELELDECRKAAQ